jgi:hypothetical protein
MLFRNEAIGGTSNNVPIAEIEKAADFFRKRNNEINVFLLKADAEERKLIKESASYTAQLLELNAKENPPTSEVTVVLDAKTYKPLRISHPFSFRKTAIEYCIGMRPLERTIEFAFSSWDDNPCLTEIPLESFQWLQV